MTAVYTCQSVIIVGLSSRTAVTPRVSVRRRLPSRRTPRRSVRNNSARLQYRCALAGSSIRRFNRQQSRHVAVRVAKWSTHVKRVCSLTLLRHFALILLSDCYHSSPCFFTGQSVRPEFVPPRATPDVTSWRFNTSACLCRRGHVQPTRHETFNRPSPTPTRHQQRAWPEGSVTHSTSNRRQNEIQY